jgi:Mg-chelatase subunit ChlD
MKMDLRHGKVCYWALIFSVAAHSVTLAVFTGVKLSGRTEAKVTPKPVISLQMIERVVAERTPKPKPRIEPIVEPAVESESQLAPLVAEPKPPADAPMEAPQVAEPVAQTQPQPDEVEFFGQKSMVRRVCYVVDCSGSMYGRMYQVKDQLKQSILNLNSRQSFSVVFFMEGQTVLTSGGTLAPATAGAKSTALELIELVRPSGSTDAEHALEQAMQLKDVFGNGAEAVYFLTDGFDLDSENSRLFSEKVNRLRNAHACDAVLHTIGFDAQPRDRQMLRRLAQNTGGAFININ